ncbi:hypothetical protein QVD17_20433 [Tagetes erecta]|uniref:Uncharacterized protein n=1 Tax=Tagetes erecta TaxID=13708 RepID=A0AAD8NY52_TARER|nr:hypothetical protein QVD17_20433 [Tagetes erecta]
MLKLSIDIGSSRGLVCLYGYNRESRSGAFPRQRTAVIWNVSIRRDVHVFVPNVGDGIYRTILGFGVCRETNDPKGLEKSVSLVDEFLYWLATNSDSTGEFNLIISFDMIREEFKELKLADTLAQYDRYGDNLYVSKLRKSLVVVERVAEEDGGRLCCMVDGGWCF